MKKQLLRIFNRGLLPIALGIFLFHNALQAQNLVKNGSLEDGTTGWNNLVGDSAIATFSIETEDVQQGTKALKIAISKAGKTGWSVQTLQTTWQAKINKVYVVRFYAKASTSDLKINVLQQTNAFRNKEFTLSTSWTLYEWEYVAAEETPQLRFWYSGVGTILLDNVTIEDKEPPVQSTKDSLIVKSAKTHQALEGFGGSIAFYNSWVTDHPNKEEIYQLLFDDLGLDWLRIRNVYRNEANFTTSDVEFVQKAKQYNPNAKVLMCSWSPPASIKDINSTDSGTLAKENGQFVYGKFADYWRDALIAYGKLGVKPDLISIQNEPDWLTTAWETNMFEPTESAKYPGYDKALDSVYNKIKDLPQSPKILGAEPLGIGYNRFDEFTNPIKNKPYLYGYAYHLYHGGDEALPDSYNGSLSNIATNFSDRPNFMTEFELYEQGWLKTAWLVSNVLTKGNSASFFYWNIVWPQTGLINLENPYEKGSWKTTKGYSINPHFYAFKHFSKPLSGGYTRIDAINKNDVVRTSAFINTNKDEVVIVVINVGAKSVSTALSLPGLKITGSSIVQTEGANYYLDKGTLPVGDSLVLPDSSITTLVLSVEPDPLSVASKGTLEEVKAAGYPNPFTKELQLSVNGAFEYTISTLTGYVTEKGAAKDNTSVGANLPSGMYLVHIKANGKEAHLKAYKY